MTIPAADYTFTQLGVRGETDSSRPVYAQGRASAGGFFGGDRIDVGATLGWRQSQHLALEGSLSRSDVDLPGGDFSATTVSVSVLGAINRSLFARSLIQYDNFSRDLQANIRVNWIHTPGSDLFFVFNTAYDFSDADDPLDPRRNAQLLNRAAVLKLTYLVLL